MAAEMAVLNAPIQASWSAPLLACRWKSRPGVLVKLKSLTDRQCLKVNENSLPGDISFET